MDLFLQRIYVGEIGTQCQFALNAVESLNQALRGVNSGPGANQDRRRFFHAEVFRQTHSFLTHASNVSRLFWPVAPEQRTNEADTVYETRIGAAIDRVRRGKVLRALFQLGEEHCLKSRVLRNHLEHYDERLDEWRRTSVNRNIASDTIGPENAIVGLAATEMMRWFDPTRNAFRFRGEDYDLRELATAIDVLLPQSRRLEDELWERQRAGA